MGTSVRSVSITIRQAADDASFYSFRVWPDAALKAAQDVGGRQVTASTRGFDPDPAASERLAGFLGTHLPAAGVHDHSATCLYTLTPDRDLVLGPVGGHDRVLVALGAAHGFKFAPCSAGSWPSWPCTAAPRSTSPGCRRPPGPHRRRAGGQVPGLSHPRPTPRPSRTARPPTTSTATAGPDAPGSGS
jgi:hypothetical protein